MIAESVPDDLPRGDQIRLPARGDQHPGADHVFDRRTGIGQRGVHGLDATGGLAGIVANGRGRPVVPQRAGTAQKINRKSLGIAAA